MPRLKWSSSALRDVERLYQFLQTESPESARRAIRSIREGVKVLAAHPDLGRSVQVAVAGLREWIIHFGAGAYVVLYHYVGAEVVLLTVRHGREEAN